MDPTVPKGAAIALDFIGEVETGVKGSGAYDVIYAHRQNRLPKPITQMTIAELQKHQASGWPAVSTASGRYQFMRATLRDLRTELGLRDSQIFERNLQDRLGYHLLKRRGFEAFIAGRISTVEFARRLAMEWASLPVLAATKGSGRTVQRGQSYYAGDGLNKSLVRPEAVEALLAQVKAAATKIGTHVQEVPDMAAPVVKDVVVADPGELQKSPAKSKTTLTWAFAGAGAIVTAVGEFFGGLDWRVQLFICAVIVVFAVYGIKRRFDLAKSVRDLKEALA